MQDNIPFQSGPSRQRRPMTAGAASNLSLWVATAEGLPDGHEKSVVVELRKRLNSEVGGDDTAGRRACNKHGLSLLAEHFGSCVGSSVSQRWTPSELGVQAYEGFRNCASQSRLVRRCAEIMDSHALWTAVERGLAAHLNGQSCLASRDDSVAGSRLTSAAPPSVGPWCSERRLTAMTALAFEGLAYQLRRVLESDRLRIYCRCLSFGCESFAARWWRYGPDYWRSPRSLVRDDSPNSDDDDDDGSAAGGAGGASPSADLGGAETEPDTAVMRSLRRELENLRGQLAEARTAPPPPGAPPLGPQVDCGPSAQGPPARGNEDRLGQSLADFATGSHPTGRISMTAQRRDEVLQDGPSWPPAGAVVGAVPPGLPPMPGVARRWSPLGGTSRSAMQAGELLTKFPLCEGREATVRWQTRHFRQDVSVHMNAGPREPDVMQLRKGNGYTGAATGTAPQPSFTAELESARDRGAPLQGVGGTAAAAASPEAGIADGLQNVSCDASLPSDMRRAAPNIYRSMRQAGSKSCREWLLKNYHGYRRGNEWTSCYNVAMEVDFSLRDCRSVGDALHRLATKGYSRD